MLSYRKVDNAFLDKVVNIIEENLDDEDFGVSGLSENLGMSRSNLLRKVQSLTGLSVSVLIRQVRLCHAQRFLKDKTHNVKEVSYKVGFRSTSYFIRCYKDEFGYSPGSEVKRERVSDKHPSVSLSSRKVNPLLIYLFLAVGIVSILWLIWANTHKGAIHSEKSVAVLPFINDSSDSSNIYVINGVMESILNSLQKIEELRVVSRSSVEKYRNKPMTSAEMADKLNVKYFIEGSGQKIDNQLLLTIQLVEANVDEGIWSQQYRRPLDDVFQLQAEIAEDIAKEVEVFVTESEKRLIRKKPTSSPEAYSHYLKGLALLNKQTMDDIAVAANYFRMAIKNDEGFASAHAYMASCYYYLDLWRNPKIYGDSINKYSDLALFYDSELDHSLIAKGFNYMHRLQYGRAAAYFEKASALNPNSARAINTLFLIYSKFLNDPDKLLSYALRGARINPAASDSISFSTMNLLISRAFFESGFVEEARRHCQIALTFDPLNLSAKRVGARILLAKGGNLDLASKALVNILAKDTLRLDVLEEVATIYYLKEDYDSAHHYYNKILQIRAKYQMKDFQLSGIRQAYVFAQTGSTTLAKGYLENYESAVISGNSAHREYYLASYYALTQEIDKGINCLRRLSEQQSIDHWHLVMLDIDPVIRLLERHNDFDAIVGKIASDFWAGHYDLRMKLKNDGLI